MLWKCCKSGKLSSGHRTGKGQFSFQFPRRAMPKNVQIIIQLHSFHMLARSCSKSSKLGFYSMWTENLQMYKLNLEKAQEQEIKLTASNGSEKKQQNSSKKICFCFIDYIKAFDCVDHNKLWKILKEMGIPDHLTCLLRNLYAGQEPLEPGIEQWTCSKLGKVYIKAVYCHPAYLTYMQSTSCKMPTGWSTSWNQDCQEK